VGKHFTLIVCFCLAITIGYSQQAQQYSFIHLTTTEGLAANFTRNIAQDTNGFIWIGTSNGLQRYDGYKFLTFRYQKNNPASLPSNDVRIFIDHKDNLWVETDAQKIGIFNKTNFTFKEVPVRWTDNSNIPHQKKFFEDSRGKIYLLIFFQELYAYDEKLGAFISVNETLKLPAKWRPIAIAEQPSNGNLWIGCDSGLFVINMKTGNTGYRNHNPDNDPVIQQFAAETLTAKIVFGKNAEWISFDTWPATSGHPYVHRYNYKTGETQKFDLGHELSIEYHEINGALVQQNGRVWHYGKTFIAEYLLPQKKFLPIKNEIRNAQNISFDNASDIFEDKAQNLWISTENGIFIFNPDAQPFTSYKLVRPDGSGTINGPTQTILQLRNGQIWVGCWAYGLYCYDQQMNPLDLPKNFPKKVSMYGSSIWDMKEDTISNKVWMVCQEGALMLYDLTLAKTEILFPEIFERRTIRQIIQDKQGNFWFGTQGGKIIKWDRLKAGGDVHKGFEEIHKGGLVHKLYCDNDGTIWAATLGRGLKKFDAVSGKLIAQFDTRPDATVKLWNDSPTDVMRFNDSIILIANGALSILNTNNNTISFFTQEEGLPSNEITSLQRDNQGTLWMGMNNGLLRMNFEKRRMAIYDRREGIQYDYFNPGQAFRIKDGKLIFTTDHNFLVFDPAKLKESALPPDVRITNIRLGNQVLSLDFINRSGKIKVPYDNTSITIDFSDMVFTTSYRITYMLENLDKDWIRADDRRQATYNYLPPGNYTFKIRSEDGDGVFNKVENSFKIVVNPPFWKTWWFYGILILFIAGILYRIDRERIKRMRDLQDVRSQIAGNLHEDITSTLNNIHLLSEMAKIKADKDTDLSKDYITQISRKSHSMIAAMDDMIWSINPENDNTQKTLSRMHEFTDSLRNNKKVEIKLVVDEKIKSKELNMKSRHELFMIFKDSLGKMVQHSTGTEILINIDLGRQRIFMKLHDNGIYATPTDVFNDSEMLVMLKRAENINAVLDIQTDNKGASVILLIPLQATS
jgi:ligand-binding sensor domain-containing protein/signal transduction histidine kinase